MTARSEHAPTSVEIREAVEKTRLVAFLRNRAEDARSLKYLPDARQYDLAAAALECLLSRREEVIEECARVALAFREEMLGNVARDSMEALAATIAINEIVQRIRSLQEREGVNKP